MFNLRPFRNTDPPAIVDIWRQQPASRGLASEVNVPDLEHHVLCKPYFDREGLIVAERDERIVGFVHAGFGPNEAMTDVAFTDGVTCMLQVLPEFEFGELRGQLLEASESYITKKGARRIHGGGHPLLNPFYHGMTETSELSGVIADDTPMHEAYQARGYEVAEEFVVMNCELARMRPVVDRNQRSLARAFEVRPTLDHVFPTWWETCTYGPTPRSMFEVVSRQDNAPCGSMIWWDFATSLGPRVALSRVEITDNRRRGGLATYLVSNALKQLKASGALAAQVVVGTQNVAAIPFFQKLGFTECNRGSAYLKPQ